MLFYCKPYFKNVFEKKQNAAVASHGAGMYNETISKPSFLMKGEKEKEIFLNGEVSELKKVSGFQSMAHQQRGVRKTIVCLKCLQVDENLKGQALRNVFNR
jgi:hypothetical protein